jgi:hypothetical protein
LTQRPDATYVIETYEFSNIDPADGSLPAGDTDISASLN